LEHQTFPAARFEVIVADCASTDNTVSTVNRFASGSPVRIRSLELESPNLAEARNQAAAIAEGRLLLFLSDDELASPRLLRNHVEAQERWDERGYLTGDIHPHPQLPNDAITRLSLDEGEGQMNYELPFYLDAQESNVSIPRRLFEQYEGFNTGYQYQRLEHIEFAFRLYRDRITCGTIEDTRTYVWQPAQFEQERARHYQVGFSLYHLLGLTHSKSILQRYRLRRSRIELVAARILMPYYVRACRRQERENTLFVGALYRRILSHDRAQGFVDARMDRSRRPPVKIDVPPSARIEAAPSLR